MAQLIQAKDLRGKRDTRLIDAVPLPSPWTMFVEPTNVCPYRCSYCPTGDTDLLRQIGRKNTLMPYELFCKVVDDMREFSRPLKQCNLYKDGESLVHPRFCDMVEYMKAAKVSERLWLKTNGQLLSPDLNARLVTCGLDMIGVSVQHVHAQGFYDVARVRVDYDEYRANVLDLYQRSRFTDTRVSVKIADVGLSDADKQKFIDDFSDRCDFIAIEQLHGWSASDTKDWKLGMNGDFDGTPRSDKIVCPLILYMLTVNSNGKVSICNDDWQQAHDIGDVNHESLFDIWNGQKLKDFRLMHLTGNRHLNKSCNGCDYVKALPDNVDSDREIFAERLR